MTYKNEIERERGREKKASRQAEDLETLMWAAQNATGAACMGGIPI